MCLSIALDRPGDVLARGEHAGFEWIVTHNGMGYRCGYIRVPVGHPWHGKGYHDVRADVHGGLTFAEPDRPCPRGAADDGHWLGFDAAHCFDAPDPALIAGRALAAWFAHRIPGSGEVVRDQVFMEAQCRVLCEQAAVADVGTTGVARDV
jgi:hypothetical protein